ncbi:MAG TPA: hypothetical protein VNO69_12830 [Methyloceanibacter sp.]|nr:hypothetical protein [Methyloceanibacter sp.]
MSQLTDSERRSLEDQLTKRLLEACEESEKAGYLPKPFRASLVKNGAVEAVSRVITSDPKTSGFAALLDAKRADLTGEAIALNGPWQALFDPKVLDQARKRLIEYKRPDLAKD